MSEALHYQIDLSQPETHLAAVTLECPVPAGADTVELAMAAWCPGSYLIRDYARFVRDLAVTGDNGAALSVTKTSKNTWNVATAGAARLSVRYTVYGHELTVRTNHIDGTHAFLHGPATFVFPTPHRNAACRVNLTGPGRNWHLATGLDRDGESLVAESVDALLDSPIHLGEVTDLHFEVDGTKVQLAIWGRAELGPAGDLETLSTDLAVIMKTQAETFGGMPFGFYSFLLMLSPGAYGGLEHRNSSANLSGVDIFASRKNYEGLLELLSHEFFHAWNGKRIFPTAWSPFDYNREAYTRCLWVVEGLTSYYDRQGVLRAKKMEPKVYLEHLVEDWARLLAIPGRARQSLEASSFDAWIKLYQPHESNVNTTVSYYLKGGLVALALDLEIRRRTEFRHSLDDVLRTLWSECGVTGKPYPEDVQPLFERAAGVALDVFFERFIRGTEDPDLAAELATAGLELVATHDPALSAGGRVPAWLGCLLSPAAQVTAALDGGPAQLGGLTPGDEIVAIDGIRVRSDADVRARIGVRRPGDLLQLSVFRRDLLHGLEIKVGEPAPTRFELRGVAAPDATQAKLYTAWIGNSHPGEGLVCSVNTTGRWA